MGTVVAFPRVPRTYAAQLDRETFQLAAGAFRSLHPDLLPIVLHQVLRDVWVGDLSDEQIKQALRDCYDMCERAAGGERGLYSPMAFVRSRLILCLENQALLLDPPVAATVPTSSSLSEPPPAIQP